VPNDPLTDGAETEPRITVAIPTRNRAEMLRTAIDSVLAQDLGQFEIIVSDNASDDHTAEVVSSYTDPRISYAPLAENIGLHGNLTRCLGLGRAPYVTILQDDDFYLPGNLAAKVAVLDAEPGVGLVHSRFHYVDPNGDVGRRDVHWFGRWSDLIEPGSVFVERSLQAMIRVNLTSAVLRRSCLSGLYFDERDGAQTDVGLWLRVGLRCGVGFVDATHTVRRVHADSLSFASGALVESEGTAAVTIDLLESAVAAQRRFMAEESAALPAPLSVLERKHAAFHARATLEVLLANVERHRTSENLRALIEAVQRMPRISMRASAYRMLLMSLAGPRGRAVLRGIKRRSLGRRNGLAR
jgi:hypothetical protein